MKMFVRSLKFALILVVLAAPLISATFHIGNDTVFHRLFKRFTSMFDAPNMNYQACVTPTGSAGHCKHLRHCSLAEFKVNYLRVFDYLCIIEQSAIGICCPDDLDTDAGRPSLPSRGDDSDLTPAESGKILNRPEDRGCGLATKQFPKITGGRPADPKEWPWMAAILRPGYPYAHCGGVLVTDRHVLTAAHCVEGRTTQNLFVRLGEYNFSSFDETRARDFKISEIRAHADFDPLSYDNDIAIIKLARPTIFTTYIWPVCIPPVGETWESWTGVIAGWGTQSYGGPHSDVLMEVSVPIWKNDDCQEKMIYTIPDTVLCAGTEEGGRDSCQGDSGGPLLVQLPNERWVAVGIVSWGVRCGEANRPGVYTRVNSFIQWIIDNSQF